MMANMVHLMGLLVGLLQGWLAGQAPQASLSRFAIKKTPPQGAAFFLSVGQLTA
ncbi:hypothetical protein ACEUBT_15630 [Aeromonas bivalvium]|uniref:hypothetical protein n=1 Tax=Aeromonas bivalvium TaxID=440079 RepID=UPI0038CF9AD5